MALHDSLTGLSNQFSFHDKLQHTINVAKRQEKQFAVLFIDLDHFKEVNDTHWHSIWDGLLQEVAQRLLSSTRWSDIVSRIWWDEFSIILTSMEKPEDYEIVAQRIVKSIWDEFVIKWKKIHIWSSIWISIYPDHWEDAETLVTHADVAMYRVKGNWKNWYFIYEKRKES
jgi:diguanylate cyclase (GGDEF)-like protein